MRCSAGSRAWSCATVATAILRRPLLQAVDFTLGWLFRGFNAVFHRDANLVDPVGTLGGADNRPLFPSSRRINGGVCPALTYTSRPLAGASSA